VSAGFAQCRVILKGSGLPSIGAQCAAVDLDVIGTRPPERAINRIELNRYRSRKSPNTSPLSARARPRARGRRKSKAVAGRQGPPAIRNMTRIWYLIASAGGTPPRICPVIIPGRETTPVADIELMVGISALRSA